MVPKPAGEQVKKPAARQVKKPAIQSRKPATRQEIYSKNHCSEDKSLRDLSSQGERDDLSGLGFPSFGAAAPDGAAPGEDQEQESSLSPTKTAPPSAPVGSKEATDQRGAAPLAPAEIAPPSEPRCRREDNRGNGATPAWDPAWQRLRALWQRGHLSDNTDKAVAIAKAAFARVMAEGIPADQVLEGAERWVAAADSPRFLPPLPTFLTTRGFERQPPPRRQSAPRQQTYHRKPKPDLARMMLALGEED
jgi:hypothetical protein